MFHVKRAFFILQDADIRDRSDADIINDFGVYGLFVCNPSMDGAKINRMRGLIPDSLYYAYDNVFDAPNKAWNDPYWVKKRQVMGLMSFSYWGDDAGVRPAYTLTEAQAENLAHFHIANTKLGPFGFDGIYFDCFTNGIPDWRRGVLTKQGFSGDVIQDIEYQYRLGRRFYTSLLRHKTAFQLVANTDGMVEDPCLHGITLETAEGDKRDLFWMLGRIGAQRQLWNEEYEFVPEKFVIWVKHEEHRRAAELISDAVDNAYVGTVRKAGN